MQNCMDEFRHHFDAAGIEVVEPDVVQAPSEEELKLLLVDIDGIIAGDDPITAEVLDSAPRLKAISKWGVGTDGIDVEAATARGISVTRTPNVFGEEVADVAIGYMVMLTRQLHRMHESVCNGGWLKVEGVSLSGKTLGVVGFGDIGRAAARRGLGFGMDVLTSDVADVSNLARTAGVSLVPFGELMARSDVVILCCPLTAATWHLLNDQSLTEAKDGVYVINVARGPLIAESALVAALETGHVEAAALDVFEEEPLHESSPLRRFEKCVFGTHNGSNTSEGVRRASRAAVDNLLEALRL
jgi:D-3-phosphoglycerate dehydrogenase / 2-oxoglutarate reductase